MKNINCVYTESTAGRRRALSKTSALLNEIDTGVASTKASPGNEGILQDANNFGLVDVPIMDDALVEPTDNACNPLIDLTSQVSFGQPLAFEGLFGFDDYTFGLSDTSVASNNKMNYQVASWCSWTSNDIDLSVVAQNSLMKANSHLLVDFQKERPHAQHSADMIIQSLRSLPTMMLRRETFPWFVHPQSHLLAKPSRAALPEAISTCMSIAQMFASRTSETTHFLWRSIQVECRHFITEVCISPTLFLITTDSRKMYNMSKFELLAALQACMIYFIMFIVDYSRDKEANSPELVQALRVSLRLLFSPQELTVQGSLFFI